MISCFTYVLLALCILAPEILAWTTPPTVTVLNGTYSGVNLDAFGQQLFLGMPYAQQPVGNQRLRPPLSLNTSWEGTNPATNYSAICPGVPMVGETLLNYDDAGYNMSEACLTINIVRPNTVTQGSSVPVMAWMYGGGFSMGSSADPRYNGSFIVARSMEMDSPIIFTSFNYRVHAFGFLGGQEVHESGNENLGLLDQRLALHWLQENVAAFGGDPTKVTIMGESAGAFSVSDHLIAYGGRDDHLFSGAIMESGSPTTSNFMTIAQLQPMYDSVVAQAGCSNATDTLQCLREVPYATFQNASFAWGWQSNGTTWQPVIDGVFITDYPTKLLNEGKYVKVPLLAGANTDECASFGTYGVNTTEEVAAALSDSYKMLSNTSINALLSLYPDDPVLGCPYGSGYGLLPSGHMDKRSLSIYGDIVMVGPRRLLAQIASQTQPVYSYRFNQIPINGSMLGGVGHFSEVAYVFSNPLKTQNPLGTRPADLALANLMTSMWISMVHDGHPNNNKVAGSPYWPNYATAPKNMVFQDAGSYVEYDTFREEGISFINMLGAELEH